jgi:transcriptional regulator with XRE-family HTH domain
LVNNKQKTTLDLLDPTNLEVKILTAKVYTCTLSEMKSLGARIRELRDEKDISLRELGKRVGPLSAAYLSDVELGRRNPTDEVLRAIAKALGTTFDELKQYDNRPAAEEMKRRTLHSPQLGFAFRRILDENVSEEELVKELLKLANDKAKRIKK